VEVEALVERAGEGSGAEGESAASLAEERVTLDDMSSHSGRVDHSKGYGQKRRKRKRLVCSNLWLAQGKVDEEVLKEGWFDQVR
jgi:hypothetical protein